MQLNQPLLLCRPPTPLAAALRMLSPASSLNPSANTRLVNRGTKPTTATDSSSCTTPIKIHPSSNPKIAFPTSQNFPQALTPFKCSFATTATNPATISNSCEAILEKLEALTAEKNHALLIQFYIHKENEKVESKVQN